MNAYETMKNILNHKNLVEADLRYCLINKDKVPFKINGEMVQPNKVNDFVKLELLCIDNLSKYAGIGISIQASKICAVDVDHCFNIPFDINSADDRAKKILNLFKNYAYCEFSFSGTGLRILFKHDVIENYSKIYYIKNSNVSIEYYQPSEKSYRYVTITGISIADNKLVNCPDSVLYEFLNNYMVRPKKLENKPNLDLKNQNKSIDELKELVKYHYLSNYNFQNVWFSTAPGSGKDESERDYYLISYMYAYITQDKNKIKELFESSPYFKSKDYQHIKKWNYNDNRYLNYIYEQIRR